MNHLSQIKQALADHHLSATAADHITLWLSEAKFSEYLPELKKMIEQADWKTLEDNFFQIIPFGTGGRRGLVGLGSNRINKVTIGESAQGLADYLLTLGSDVKAQGIVIANDTRLTSVKFSQYVASIFAANNFITYLFDDHRTTPELSFAVRHLQTAAGAVISASHNPPTDNGFKVYWSDGGQIVAPHDAQLMTFGSRVKTIKTTDFAAAKESGQIKIIGPEVDQAYITALANESLHSSRSAVIAYSPLHGTGTKSVLPVLKSVGFKDINLVEQQLSPDGHFPNIAKNIPNPEVISASDEVTKLAQATQSDIAITTDPDADRLGVIAHDSAGHYQFLTGNQIAALICFYVLDQLKKQNKLKTNHFLVKTIVTTDFITALAQDFGVKIYDNILIGFKYVAELIHAQQDLGQETFLFGGEESHGILKGSYTRDKDAAIAALMISEFTSLLKDNHTNLVVQLDQLYRRYGLYWETLDTIVYPGATGGQKMAHIMSQLRAHPPTTLGTEPVLDTRDRLTSHIGTKGDVLIYYLSPDQQNRLTIRPSGTEPKIKVYTQLHQPLDPKISDADLSKAKQAATDHAKNLTQSLLAYTAKL